jgi:predicted metal-dependent hydrolase
VPEVEIRRSKRRSKTVSLRREGERLVALVPQHVTDAQLEPIVARLLARMEKREARRRPGDDELEARARELSRRYVAGAPMPTSVRWVSNMTTRWGSCTAAEGAIRISDQLQGMPPYVVDYVLVHELAHLVEANHSDRFWQLVSAYPRTERARGFLEGVEHSAPPAS